MKQFIVDRHTTPNTPTLEQVPTEKIPIYNDIDAVTADIANLEVGQIGATKGTGSELSAPVDVVQSGNMHAVTSNAVAESCTKYPDYSKPIQIASSGVRVTSWIATKDCFVQFLFWSGATNPINLLINNNVVSTYDVYNGVVSQFSGYIKKGDVVSISNSDNINRNDILRLFELRS
jgi:hypothetical protein